MYITLFKAITILCRTDNMLNNINHIHIEYEEYSTKYYQSGITLL